MGEVLRVVATGAAREGAAAKHRQATAAVGWHRWLPWVIVVVAAVIALVSALNVWVTRQALNTDNWTSSSSQLLADPEIRGALSVCLVDQIYDNVDVSEVLAERLPPNAKALAVPLAAALEQPAVRTANALLARPRVQALWEEANRRAHTLLMAVIDGKEGLLDSTNGNVVLDLGPVIDRVAERTGLGARVEARLPADAGRIVVMEGSQLDTAR